MRVYFFFNPSNLLALIKCVKTILGSPAFSGLHILFEIYRLETGVVFLKAKLGQ